MTIFADKLGSPEGRAEGLRFVEVGVPPTVAAVIADSARLVDGIVRAGHQFNAAVYVNAVAQDVVWTMEGRWNLAGATTTWKEVAGGTQTAGSDDITVIGLADGILGPNEFRLKWSAASGAGQCEIAAAWM